MSIHVICPGCLKRFQVAARFAGMQGPCPNCAAVISIPTEAVEIHGDDDDKPKKTDQQRSLSRPIQRHYIEFDPILAGQYALGILGVLLFTFLFGCIPMYAIVRSFLATLGLCLVAFPLVLFGYQFIRDRDHVFSFTGGELYYRTGFAAAGYVILWFGFEYFLAVTQAGGFISWAYFLAFAVLATLLAHLLLVMKTQDAFLHYCFFGLSIGLLRFLIGLGWFWESSGLIRYSNAPMPPLLPGM